MTFDVKPTNSELSEILDAAVTGPCHVVNDSWNSYVQLVPALGASLTVRASDRLRLNDGAAVKSTDQPMTFVVMYDDATMEMFLVELVSPGARIVKKAAARSPVEKPIKAPPRRPAKKAPQLIVQPDLRAPVPAPVSTGPMPSYYHDLRATHDIQDGLGDYLVVPSDVSLPEPIPPWVVRTPNVSVMHVVKPRIPSDTAL
jgi:hypothetical protein